MFTNFKYTAVGPESNSRLQFDRFNFSEESMLVVGEELTDHVEHGVTEATDIENVSSLASLNRLARLQIDANQRWVGFLTRQLALVGSYQRQRTICSTTTVLCQSLGNAQDRIVWVNLRIVSRRIERNR